MTVAPRAMPAPSPGARPGSAGSARPVFTGFLRELNDGQHTVVISTGHSYGAGHPHRGGA